MDELFPVILGIVVGLFVGFVPRRLRAATLAVASVCAGAAATILSGEYATSYAYLLIDLSEAGVGCAMGLLFARVVVRFASRRIRG